jgi:hypothetical protein
MSDDFWSRSAQLLRGSGGMALIPDPPIWMDPGVVAEGSFAEIVRQFVALPWSHQRFYAIVTETDHYLKADEIRAFSRRGDFPLKPKSRKPPIVYPPAGDSIRVDVLLDDRPVHLAARRTIMTSDAAVARHLNFTVGELGAHNFERFVRANVVMICKRAVALHNSRNTVHLRAIDDPTHPGLPALLYIREGEL